MKGLIYKEFLLGKKSYLGFLALVVGVGILGILVGLGTRFGNIQDYTVQEKSVFFNIFVYFTYVVLLLASAEICRSIDRDKTSGWKKIEVTMPVSAKKRIGALYLTGGMVLGGCFLIGLMNAGLMTLMFGQSMTCTTFKNMVLILLGFVVGLLVIIPLYQRFPSKSIERTWNIVIIVLSVVVLIVTLVIVFKFQDSPEQFEAFANNLLMKAKEFADGFLCLSLIIIPLLIVGSFALSVRWYQRRDK